VWEPLGRWELELVGAAAEQSGGEGPIWLVVRVCGVRVCKYLVLVCRAEEARDCRWKRRQSGRNERRQNVAPQMDHFGPARPTQPAHNSLRPFRARTHSPAASDI